MPEKTPAANSLLSAYHFQRTGALHVLANGLPIYRKHLSTHDESYSSMQIRVAESKGFLHLTVSIAEVVKGAKDFIQCKSNLLSHPETPCR